MSSATQTHAGHPSLGSSDRDIFSSTLFQSATDVDYSRLFASGLRSLHTSRAPSPARQSSIDVPAPMQPLVPQRRAPSPMAPAVAFVPDARPSPARRESHMKRLFRSIESALMSPPSRSSPSRVGQSSYGSEKTAVSSARSVGSKSKAYKRAGYIGGSMTASTGSIPATEREKAYAQQRAPKSTATVRSASVPPQFHSPEQTRPGFPTATSDGLYVSLIPVAVPVNRGRERQDTSFLSFSPITPSRATPRMLLPPCLRKSASLDSLAPLVSREKLARREAGLSPIQETKTAHEFYVPHPRALAMHGGLAPMIRYVDRPVQQPTPAQKTGFALSGRSLTLPPEATRAKKSHRTGASKERRRHRHGQTMPHSPPPVTRAATSPLQNSRSAVSAGLRRADSTGSKGSRRLGWIMGTREDWRKEGWMQGTHPYASPSSFLCSRQDASD